MNTKSQRELWLDNLKGFGILLVIFGHVLSGYMDAYTFPDAYWDFYKIRTWIYSFHMPMFFMVSGYAFSLAYWREGKLRKQGFFRQLGNLFLVYTIFVLLQWLVKQAVPELVNEAYTLKDLLRMYVEPLGNFWYLYVLFIFYALAGLASLPRRSPWWLVPLWCLAVYVVYIALNQTNLTLYRILYHLFFFALGCILEKRKHLLKNNQMLSACIMVLLSMCYFYFYWWARTWAAPWQALIALCTSLFNLCLFCRCFSRLPVFRVFGKYCLELYLLHTFFTGGLRSVLTLWGLTAPWLSVWVNFIFSTAASLLIAWACSKFRWGGILFRPLHPLKK